MKRNHLYISFALIALSCTPDATNSSPSENYTISSYDYIDSTSYRPDKNLMLAIKALPDSNQISIYILKDSKRFELYQRIDSLDSQFGDTTPVYEDFDGDGLNDIKIQYGTGARGANELYHLLLQDFNTGKLTYIKGSVHIPNLSFDVERQVINGVYYYGGTSFIDFALQGDTLVQVRGIDVSTDGEWTFREFYEFDKSGKKVFIRKDSVNDQGAGLYSID